MASLKLLDEVRRVLRVKNYSYRTEKTYIHWIRKFILFNNKKHPLQMAETEINHFLTFLPRFNLQNIATIVLIPQLSKNQPCGGK